jgi:CBS domain containing-hemolysin-like protein
MVANLIGPLTALIVNFLGTVEGSPAAEQTGTPAADARLPAEKAATEAEEENRLLRSVVDFGDTLVREVMTPRPDIVALPAASSIDDLRKLVREQEYSRLPVFADNLDNIVGLVVVKDLIQRADELDGSRLVSEIMRPASFVPETKRVMDLFGNSRNAAFSWPSSSTSTAAPRAWSPSKTSWRNWSVRFVTSTTARPSRLCVKTKRRMWSAPRSPRAKSSTG